jgi:AcrR family transcriptional regulator
MGRVLENKRLKQKALLESAFDLFTKKGINNTSVSDIANNAMLAKGTFYLYYKDKYSIRDSLIAIECAKTFRQAAEKIHILKEDHFEDVIVKMVNVIIEQFEEHPNKLKFISKNLSWGIFQNLHVEADNAVIREMIAKDDDPVNGIVPDKQFADDERFVISPMMFFNGLIKDSGRRFRKPELMIYMIVELVSSTCYSVILDHDPADIGELKPELDTAIIDIIRQFEIKEPA